MASKMNLVEKVGLGLIGFWVVLVCFVVTSWFVNITKLIECDFEPSYKAEVVHAIGIFPPASVITAWVDVGK